MEATYLLINIINKFNCIAVIGQQVLVGMVTWLTDNTKYGIMHIPQYITPW